MLTMRPVNLPEDCAALSALDTSFVTERIYQPVREGFSFHLVEASVTPPLRKRYDINASDPEEWAHWDFTALAEVEGRIAGFAAARYVAWNRRVVVEHLYVALPFRHQGVGTRLLGAADAYARTTPARCLWLETQNVNYPAIQFYQRSGFRFCGFDATLYDPDALASEEMALFFSRPIAT